MHTQSHLVENFRVYLQTKNQLHPPRFSGDIAKICTLILGTLGKPGYADPNDIINFDVYLYARNKPDHSLHFSLEILYFKEPCNLIGQQHLGP